MCTKNELNSILQKLTQIYRSVYGENLVQVILYGSYDLGKNSVVSKSRRSGCSLQEAVEYYVKKQHNK